MRSFLLLAVLCVLPIATHAQSASDDLISPSRPVASGKAPGVKIKLVRQGEGERVFAVIFSRGDEVVGGLTDFATKYHIIDAHFTGIGAVSDALTAYFLLDRKLYQPLPVKEQVEVLSLIGDIAMYQGKPIVHAHVVLGRKDGTTAGGHLFEAHVNPTLEVFVTADDTPLGKSPDPSGLRVIDPAQ